MPNKSLEILMYYSGIMLYFPNKNANMTIPRQYNIIQYNILLISMYIKAFPYIGVTEISGPTIKR